MEVGKMNNTLKPDIYYPLKPISYYYDTNIKSNFCLARNTKLAVDWLSLYRNPRWEHHTMMEVAVMEISASGSWEVGETVTLEDLFEYCSEYYGDRPHISYVDIEVGVVVGSNVENDESLCIDFVDLSIDAILKQINESCRGKINGN